MAGRLKDDVLKLVTDQVATVLGDFAEVGVYKADLFKRLTPIAKHQGKLAHGFDSFCGMDEPTEKDAGAYRKGHLSVGGVAKFRQLMDAAGVRSGYLLYEGYVPECLNKLPRSVKFSFAYLDLDQYAPTVTALAWVHPRMNPGGILGLDDYFAKKCLASLAIDEFREQHGHLYDVFNHSDNQLFLRRRR